MDHWLNMHDFVTTLVFDEPMNILKLPMQCEMLVGYFTGQNGHFAIENGGRTHKIRIKNRILLEAKHLLIYTEKTVKQ